MAGMSCGTVCLKYILFVFNFIIWIFSAIILGVSIWMAVDPTFLERIGIAMDGNNKLFYAAVYTMIAVGAFIFLVSFMGCCGACKESSCLLLTYAIIMSIILILEIVGGILAAVFQKQISQGIKERMERQVRTQYEGDGRQDAFHVSWDNFHQQEKCCAVNGPKDWRNSTFRINNPLKVVPESCCKLNDKKEPVNISGCYAEATTGVTDLYSYQTGCFNQMEDWVKNNFGILIGIAFAVAAIQVFVIIFACCLRRSLDDMQNVV